MRNANKYLLWYYIFLLLIFASRQGNTAPSLIIRLAFMVLAILPTVLTNKVSYPAVITLFFTLTLYGFAYSYMPYTLSLYVFVTLLMTIFIRFKYCLKTKIPFHLLFFPIYIFLVDSISGIGRSGSVLFEDSVYCFMIVLCFLSMPVPKTSTSLKQLSLVFIVISIVLSIYFLLNREAFAVSYDYSGKYERSGWIDPNYFGTILGMGVVIAFSKLLDRNKDRKNRTEDILSFAAIMLTLPVLLLNASRGAILSVIVAGVVLFMFAKAKIWHKFLIIIVAILVLIYLYNNQYMDLLAYRIANDGTGGSGRLSIWSSKLAAFSRGSLFNILFGYGYVGGLNVSGRLIGFHNDYVAFLVDYGIVGFFLFMYMMFYPLMQVPRKSYVYPRILSITLYLSVTCLTLEPLTAGRLPYFIFYLLALLYTYSRPYESTFHD